MRGAIAPVALEESRRWVEHERQQRAVGLGEIERTLDGMLRSDPVSECVACSRFQYERKKQTDNAVPRHDRAVEDRHQRRRGLLGVVLGESQRSERGADLGGLALFATDLAEAPLGFLEVSHAHEREECECARPRREHVGCENALGQPFRRSERGERVLVIAARQFE
ncbi:MAG TPA: hypothetical protein VE570_00645 [Thermoleophilaceae bacterium]|nr:hypothetical protein [Thermoleophilaceae bacterium]